MKATVVLDLAIKVV